MILVYKLIIVSLVMTAAVLFMNTVNTMMIGVSSMEVKIPKFLEKYKENVIDTCGLMGGTKVKVMFANGFGASIIKTSFSYGGNRGLWELALVNKDGLIYDNDKFSDVVGYLEESGVVELLEYIKEYHTMEHENHDSVQW